MWGMHPYLENLNKVWENTSSGPARQEDLVAAAREVLNLTYPSLSIKYPAFKITNAQSLKTLPTVGVIGVPVVFDDPHSLRDRLNEIMTKELGISFDADRHIPVFVPTQILGGASYVIFELPTAVI